MGSYASLRGGVYVSSCTITEPRKTYVASLPAYFKIMRLPPGCSMRWRQDRRRYRARDLHTIQKIGDIVHLA